VPRKKTLSPTDWPSRLKEAGLRSTALSVSVLRTLEAHGRSYSHDELAQELTAEGRAEKVDRVTLYRILDRLRGADRAWRHTLAEPAASGYFECGQCHEITALPTDPISSRSSRGCSSASTRAVRKAPRPR
jgi:Fur family transcriptional regulator, ferric uptake regulator